MNKGFSLIEMSIGVVISSLIFISFMTMYFNFMKEDQFFITSQKLKVIESAVLHYTENYGHLPCPASLSAQTETSGYGTATDCTASAPSGTTDYGSSNAAIRIGAIPFKTLGIEDKYSFDGWRNRFTYIVVKNLATNSSTFASYPVAGASAILIRDKNSNQIHTDLDTSYVILSHGEKGSGATNLQGTQVKSCDTSLEAENCNNDNIFIDSDYNPSTTAANYYDDTLRWNTRTQVISRTKLAISLN